MQIGACRRARLREHPSANFPKKPPREATVFDCESIRAHPTANQPLVYVLTAKISAHSCMTLTSTGAGKVTGRFSSVMRFQSRASWQRAQEEAWSAAPRPAASPQGRTTTTTTLFNYSLRYLKATRAVLFRTGASASDAEKPSRRPV